MKVLVRIAKEAKRYKGHLIAVIISTLALTGINLIAPKLMSEMANLVAAGLDEEALNQIIIIAVVLLGLYLCRVLFSFLNRYLAHRAAWSLVGEMRVKVYSRLQALSMDFHRNNRSGDLVSRTISDTAAFELLYAHILADIVTSVITFVGVSVILFFINVKLAILTCIPIPFIFLLSWVYSTKVRPYFRRMQRALGILSAQLVDNLAGIQEIQVFDQQKAAEEKVEEKASAFTRFMVKALWFNAVMKPSVEFLTALGSVIVVGFGGYLAYLGQISVGDIVAFLLYLALFYAPITGLGNMLEELQQSLAGAERIIEVLDAPQTVYDRPGATPLKNPRGEITFENVSFSYVEDAPVLQDVSFAIKPGQMVALVGATGVGKSTIAQLISRFYEPQSGVIKLDGRDLKSIELSDLRSHIAMVLQDTYLFNGTIAENIAFSKPLASKEEIYDAARVARIHDEILAMPKGYETEVGERGAKLSGGQKQRIAIARAILYGAPVLILDEATASVDVKTELDIQQTINDLAGTKTIVAIAHRLSTVRRASCIFVFKDGRIVQQGTHSELSSQPGLYREMVEAQESDMWD